MPKSIAEQFWSRVRIGSPDECWPWQGAHTSNGYGNLKFEGKYVGAHRIAWMLTFGHPGRYFVLHSCDNPPCCNPFDLFLGTQATNIADMAAKGRAKWGTNPGRLHGEAHSGARLTLEQVHLIRARYAAGGISQSALGAMFGVTQVHVSRIVRGTRWQYDITESCTSS